jgi:hypothetical protein
MDVDFIIAYEAGELGQEATVAGFQKGIDDGTVWHLQGSYGRMAARLIENGLCKMGVPPMLALPRLSHGRASIPDDIERQVAARFLGVHVLACGGEVKP